MPQRNVDAEFFALVHQVMQRAPAGPVERRRGNRFAYDCVQWIAERGGAAPPEQAEFFPVRCREISREGLSFMSPRGLNDRSLFVALGQDANLLLLTAKVVYHQQIDDGSRPRWIVGCQFTGRVQEVGDEVRRRIASQR